MQATPARDSHQRLPPERAIDRLAARSLVLLSTLLLWFGAPAFAATNEDRLIETLTAAVLDDALAAVLDPSPAEAVRFDRRAFGDDEVWIYELLRAFYRDRDDRPVFTRGVTLSRAGQVLLRFLDQSWTHGIPTHQLHDQEMNELLRILNATIEDPDLRQQVVDESALDDVVIAARQRAELRLAGRFPAPRALTSALQNRVSEELERTLRRHAELTGLVATRKRAAAAEIEGLMALALIRYALVLSYANDDASPTRPALDEARELLTSRGYYDVVSGGPPPLRIPESTDEVVLTPDEWRLDNLDMLLARSVGGVFLEEALDALAPSSVEYRGLRETLIRYHGYAREGGWARLPLDLDISDPDDAAQLRLRLEREDYLSAGQTLVEALQRYQRAHQLAATGEPDRYTLLTLNISVQERIAQLALSLASLRAAPWRGHEDETHIQVNIPGFEATLHHEGVERLRWNVVVGKVRGEGINHTPGFSSLITEMELNPNWYPPRRLQPASTGDQVVVPHGPNNPMGEVKFLFPNEHFVYMHDTNRPELLDAPWRPWSAGCVRVDGARELAAHLLALDRGMDLTDARSRITRSLDSGRRDRIYLREAIPVHLSYRSAWLSPEGEAHFGLDLYGAQQERTESHIAWLEARYPELEAERPTDRYARIQQLVQRGPGLRRASR